MCVCVCARVCVRACVRVCVCVWGGGGGLVFLLLHFWFGLGFLLLLNGESFDLSSINAVFDVKQS